MLRGAAAVLGLSMAAAASAQISLATAVALAEKHSAQVRAAEASVRQAAAGLTQSRDAYIPNFAMGTSPGYAYGFPLGEPSLFTATSQSLAFSFSQPDYIRAAREALKSARLSLSDTRQQVALDTSLDYIELDHDLKEIAALDQEEEDASNLAQVEQQRVAAGVDTRMTELQAELTAAQVEEKRIHRRNDADEMRQKLEHLTGLPSEGLMTVGSSIPAAPGAAAARSGSASPNNAGIAAADANAKSKLYLAFGDEKVEHRPLITFGAEYSYFEPFANYSQYYQDFQYNNAAIGVQITIPLFDAAKRAQARISRAAAQHAEAEADESRGNLSEETLTMRRTIEELAAQEKVARIQSEIAEAQLKSIESEAANGSGSATGPAATPVQEDQAKIEERERYEDLLDAKFALLKVELNLLKATGQIGGWVNASLQ